MDSVSLQTGWARAGENWQRDYSEENCAYNVKLAPVTESAHSLRYRDVTPV
jgi:hypothetical protein